MRKLFLLILSVSALFFSGCSSKEVVAGYQGPKEVSTYLVAPLMSTQETEDALKAQGFEILSVSKVGKSALDSIVFTNDHLKTLADRPGRGFAAGALRALVNTEAKEVRISNPRYFVRAFLQKDYQLNDEQPLLDALNKAFGELKHSEDKWDFDGLANYQFMIGRPYYQDVIVAGEGENEALKSTLEKNAKKGLIFKLELSEGRTLYGVDLDKRTMKFVDKIGVHNAGLLPWMVLVENGKATAMRADYYIAISYPLLDMGGFMGIMTVPGAVEKDIGKYFK
ncbi:MAG: hypothetical protein IBX43_08590 [Campylobacterales bacterium]|nr:hypothetical protein [Campylobacterales bacterium]